MEARDKIADDLKDVARRVIVKYCTGMLIN